MMRIFIALLTLFICAFDARAYSLPSPIDYFGAPDFRHFSLSPSGRYLATARDLPLDEIDHEKSRPERQHDRQLNTIDYGAGDQIVIYDFDQNMVVQTFNVQDREVYWLHWANDERLLASISADYSYGLGRGYTFVVPAARTVSFTPFSDEKPVMLFADERSVQRSNLSLSAIVDPLPDDPNHVLMAAYKRDDLDLWRVNVDTGDAVRIATGSPRTFAWVADGLGKAAFRLDKNARGSIMTVFAPEGEKRWRKVVTTRLDEENVGERFWPLGRGENDHELYVRTKPADQERASVAIYNLETAELFPPVIENPEFDLSSGMNNPHTGRFFGAWYIADRIQTSLLDENLQKHMEAVNAYFDNDANVAFLSASKDFNRLLLEVSGPGRAAQVYAYNRKTRQVGELFALRTALRQEHLADVEMLDITARDGLTFRAYLTHPAGLARDEPAPLVVMPHGGPAIRDFYTFDPYAQFLASRGYRVLQPNFRGSRGYGAAFEEAAFGEWGGKMQDDVMDAFHQVRARGLVKDGKACIVGGSYGGYVALYAAIATPEEFACAVSTAGVTDLIDLVRHDRQNGPEAFEYVKQQVGDPRRDKDVMIARSPARNAEKIAVPLLLIHGSQDSVVPFDQFTKLTKALDKAEISYEKYVVYDGHQFMRTSSTVQSMRRVERFLARHLGGASD